MSLTITIPGAVNVTTGAMAPAVLTIGVGVPGAQGPQGPAGPGVPAGGTAGQFLTKIDGTNYNTDWTTVNLSAYAPLASPAFTGNPTAPTAALGDNDTSLATTAFVQQELLSGTANARNLEVYVRNQTGSTIPAGSIVYINGATGNRPTITLAQANNDANSAQTFGFVKASIANNGFGYVIVRGELENVDTSALTEGVQLYLSPTTAGTWTTTKPSAPQHLVYVGICVRAHPTQGVILVAVQNGYELPELHDVKITSPTNGQVLKYDSAQSLWVNGTDSSGVAWGAITGTLSAQTDLQSALDAKLAVTTAASTYQTLSGMSSYLTTSAAATTYAPLASPALTGNVTITSNSSGAALFIEQAGAGNILTLHDQATDTNFVAIDANGKVSTIPSEATNGAGFNIAHGVAPTTPVNGDIWTTTSGLFARINAGTQQFAALNTNNTFSNASSTYGNSTAAGTLNFGTGATISGATKTVNVATGGVVGSTTTTTIGPVLGASTTSIGNTTAASTLNLATGATLSGSTKAVFMATGGVLGSTTNVIVGSLLGASTIWIGDTTAASALNLAAGATTTGLGKTVNIGTSGAAGSTTNITIGSTTGTSTTTLQGNTNGVTQSPGNNTTAVATTAFVTAAVPAIATVAQVYASTSSTTATPPLLAPLAFNSGGYFPRMNFASTTSGTGASVGGADHRFEIIGPNVSTAGFAQIATETSQMWSAGTTFTILQFSKPVWFSFRMCNFSATYDGDAQTEIKAFIGNSVSGGVDPSSPAVGIYKAGGAGSFINLMVHDGTTLTKVATTTTFSTTVVDVAIYSNNGTVNLYLNGVLAATTTAGPTGTSNTNKVIAAVKASATAAVRQLLEIANIKVFAPQ